jgi:hypothetical protein
MKSTLIHNPSFNGWIFEGDSFFLSNVGKPVDGLNAV